MGFHVDDERVTSELACSVAAIPWQRFKDVAGVLLSRLTVFMDAILHGHYPTYHLRLFRATTALRGWLRPTF